MILKSRTRHTKLLDMLRQVVLFLHQTNNLSMHYRNKRANNRQML